MSNEIPQYRETVQDVAEHFEVHPNTVHNWLATTDIPHRRVGRTIRFNLIEVDEWAARKPEAA